MPLEDVQRGIDLLLAGRGDPRGGRPRREGRPDGASLEELDGRIGQGWGGPGGRDGCHVNVVLARRGSPTAAAALGMFAHPAPGHTPVQVCVGPDQPSYEPIWPPTLMMNKSTALEDPLQTLTWGAAQLGIGQGVLDAVADGLIEATLELIVMVAVWVDPTRRGRDRDPARRPRGHARGDRGVRASGRDAAAVQRLVDERDALRNPFYSGD